MQAGNSKHAAWVDEHLAHDTRPLTHQGPGAGRAQSWRDPEPLADDEYGALTGITWHEPPTAAKTPDE